MMDPWTVQVLRHMWPQNGRMTASASAFSAAGLVRAAWCARHGRGDVHIARTRSSQAHCGESTTKPRSCANSFHPASNDMQRHHTRFIPLPTDPVSRPGEGGRLPARKSPITPHSLLPYLPCLSCLLSTHTFATARGRLAGRGEGHLQLGRCGLCSAAGKQSDELEGLSMPQRSNVQRLRWQARRGGTAGRATALATRAVCFHVRCGGLHRLRWCRCERPLAPRAETRVLSTASWTPPRKAARLVVVPPGKEEVNNSRRDN